MAESLQASQEEEAEEERERQRAASLIARFFPLLDLRYFLSTSSLDDHLIVQARSCNR